jgi:large subunit ribosomal protein L24
MDKILRRVRMAERNVARRTKRQKYIMDGMDRRRKIQELKQIRGHAGAELGSAIKARHEDLELGPLAPKRDIFKTDQFGNYWGTLASDRATLSPTLTDAKLEARAAWAGGTKLLCLARGDRVVVTEGPYKGQIAAISQIIKRSMSLELEGNVGLVRSLPHVYAWRHAHTYGNRPTSKSPPSSSRRTKRLFSRSRDTFPSHPSGSYTRSKTR